MLAHASPAAEGETDQEASPISFAQARDTLRCRWKAVAEMTTRTA
jgi:hypothetical protein